MKKIPLFAFCFLFSVFTFATPSPVVQVVSYKNPLGMYFSLQGWGTGSIIDQSGNILTNNHVVDDGEGGISDAFAVCITQDSALPPQCHYTASVLARDPAKDIALLRLDPKDIFGIPVNFSQFSPLSIDYEYVPNSGDAVIARGYPWVGANTITQTQGIVSGTYDYNDNTYIKTDTLIAGGNSGGPLLRDGKMVGVNTFLIGGSSDPSLGYSLSISEAREFILNNSSRNTFLQTHGLGFPPFLKYVDTFQKEQKLVDPLITFQFPQKYTISDYLPGVFINGQISEESNTAVSAFSFIYFKTPPLTTNREMELFLDGLGLSYGDIRLKTVTIGGQPFYEIEDVASSDVRSKTEYVYFRVVDRENFLILFLSVPMSDELTFDTIQKNKNSFLSGISFPARLEFQQKTTFDIVDLDVTVSAPKNATIDYGRGFLFDYSTVLNSLNLSAPLLNVRWYENLWSHTQISITQNSFYTDDLSLDDILKKIKESYFLPKTSSIQKITYKGHSGFYTCDDFAGAIDEKGINRPSSRCELVLLVGEKNSYFLTLSLITKKATSTVLSARLKEILDSTLLFKKDGITDFGSEAATSFYADVDDQSDEFQSTLKKLLEYGILSQRKTFDGDHPLTWSQYVALHIWSVYHKRLTDHIDSDDKNSPTFAQIISQLPINMQAYVDSSQRYSFELMLRMKLAGVSLPLYSEFTLREFENQKNKKFAKEWAAIEEFEYDYYDGNKIGLDFYTGNYDSRYMISFDLLNGLKKQSLYSEESLQFDNPLTHPDLQKELEEDLACTLTAARYFSPACYQKRKESYSSFQSYFVLTKGEALNALIPSIDFGLWDPELAKKKTLQIDTINAEDV